MYGYNSLKKDNKFFMLRKYKMNDLLVIEGYKIEWYLVQIINLKGGI